MNKKAQIKVKNKKVKANIEEWMQIVKAALKAHHKNFSFMKRLQGFFQKNKKDLEKEICKEIIQRMENKKLVFDEAQQLALNGANNLKEIQKGLPKVLIYLLGGGAMLILSIVFLFLRFPDPFKLLDYNLIAWTVLSIINAFIFYKGLNMRKTFEQKLLTNSILSQAAASYAYSRSPGKGGSLFEAYHYLEIIREKNKQAFDKKFGLNKKKK